MASFRLLPPGEKSGQFEPSARRIRAAGAALAALVLAGCATLGEPAGAARETADIGRQRLILPGAPPEIGASTPGEVEIARLLVERYSPLRLQDQRRSRRIEAVQTPLLYEAPAGQRFLAAIGARGLAVGEPAEICPAIGLSLSDLPAPRAETAGAALNDCLARLRRADADETCGCRLIALDDTLLAEQTSFAYARGVTARLLDPEGGFDEVLVAEERSEATDAEDVRIWFLDALRPRAVARLSGDGVAELALLTGENGALEPTNVYTGYWRPEGFRRGRFAERLYLTDEAGGRLIALIGYEPAELAAREHELTTWVD